MPGLRVEASLNVSRIQGRLTPAERAKIRTIRAQLRVELRAYLNRLRKGVRAVAPSRAGSRRLTRSFRVRGRPARGADARGELYSPVFYASWTNDRGFRAGWWDAATAGVQADITTLERRTRGRVEGLSRRIRRRRRREAEEERERAEAAALARFVRGVILFVASFVAGLLQGAGFAPIGQRIRVIGGVVTSSVTVS